ncbi:MAG: DUF5693 family protein, partial [Armatimonadetes bacterium]|nr:DUF5693 family protein [Armatimonadota bacterium]
MHRSLWGLWAIGVISAIFAAGLRWQIERQYQTVALIVDGNEVRTLQALTGKPMAEILNGLKQSNATGVAVSAELLTDLVQIGKVQVKGESLVASSPEILSRVRNSIESQFGVQLPEPRKELSEWVLNLPSPNLLASPIFVGLDKELAEAARKVGLSVVARLPNPVGLTETGLRFWIDEIRDVNAFAAMFEGEEVFGYRTLLPAVADAFKQTDCQVGILELVSQKGDKSLASMLPEKVVRVHSVSARELVNFSQPELVDRFVRAVRERNIRLCYIRIPFHLKGDPLTVAQEYLSTLSRELSQKGFLMGTPSPMPSSTIPIWLWVLICLGAVTTGIAFLCLFIPLSTFQQLGLTLIGIAAGIVLRALHPILAAKLVALGIAIVAPVLAVWFGARQTLRSGSRWKRATMGIATCLAMTVACGLV